MMLAGIFGTIWNFITMSPDAIFQLILIVLGFVVVKFLVPLLKSQLSKSIASHLLIIADDVTDYYVDKYPNSKPAEWIDQAVDKIIEVMGVSRETAKRAAIAALQRKG